MHLVWTNPLHFYGLGIGRLRSSSGGKDPGTLVTSRLNISWQGALARMKATSMLACIQLRCGQ